MSARSRFAPAQPRAHARNHALEPACSPMSQGLRTVGRAELVSCPLCRTEIALAIVRAFGAFDRAPTELDGYVAPVFGC